MCHKVLDKKIKTLNRNPTQLGGACVWRRGASPVFQVFVVAESEVLEQEPEVTEPEVKLG